MTDGNWRNGSRRQSLSIKQTSLYRHPLPYPPLPIIKSNRFFFFFTLREREPIWRVRAVADCKLASEPLVSGAGQKILMHKEELHNRAFFFFFFIFFFQTPVCRTAETEQKATSLVMLDYMLTDQCPRPHALYLTVRHHWEVVVPCGEGIV